MNSRVYLWKHDPEMARRFLAEFRPEPGDMRSLPPAERWGELGTKGSFPVLLAAGDAESLPWGDIRELREKHSARLLLLLPDCDLRLWRRLTRLGFLNVLSPPFKHLNLELEFAEDEEFLPLFRRLPELDDRIHTRVEFSLPADLKYVAPAAGFISRLAREHAFPARVWAETLPLAIDEALSNAIEHGCGQDPRLEVMVQVWFQHDVLKVMIEDPGSGFKPETQVDPTGAEGLTRSRGRGIHIMRELMDRVHYEREGSVILLYARRR